MHETNPPSDERKKWLRANYESNRYYQNMRTRLRWIYLHLNEELNLSGKDILDLGCGSTESSAYDHTPDRGYEAWFPRFCALNGARSMVGIDLYGQDPQDEDLYTHVTANLIPLIDGNGLVDMFKDKKFDLINTDGLIEPHFPGAIFLMTLSGDVNKNTLPAIYTLITEHLLSRLKDQASLLLKPKGLLAINREVFQLDPQQGLVRMSFSNRRAINQS